MERPYWRRKIQKLFAPPCCRMIAFSYLVLIFDHAWVRQVKILYAGWRRDGTWPDNAAVVDDDDFFGPTEPHTKGELFIDNVTPLTMFDTSSLTGKDPR
jgi:hypothetical protein